MEIPVFSALIVLNCSKMHLIIRLNDLNSVLYVKGSYIIYCSLRIFRHSCFFAFSVSFNRSYCVQDTATRLFTHTSLTKMSTILNFYSACMLFTVHPSTCGAAKGTNHDVIINLVVFRVL